MTDLSPCGELVRQGDPARFRTALFAPPEAREGLFALYAFNLEIAKVAPMVSEPMIGEIRLQWWRDSLDMAFGDGPVRRHEVVEPLADIIRSAALPRAPFDALIDARARDLDPAPFSDLHVLLEYLRDTAGSVVLLAARALGGEADDAALMAGQGIGAARYLAAVPALTMQGRVPLPDHCGLIDWKALRDGDSSADFADTARYLALLGRGGVSIARNLRSSVPAAVAPAFMGLAHADKVLRDMERRCDTLASLVEAGPSPFRENLSFLWRGIAGRW